MGHMGYPCNRSQGRTAWCKELQYLLRSTVSCCPVSFYLLARSKTNRGYASACNLRHHYPFCGTIRCRSFIAARRLLLFTSGKNGCIRMTQKPGKNDFHETVKALFSGQCANGSWSNALIPTIRALFGLHLTVRQKDPKIQRGLEWLLSEGIFSERSTRPANGPHRVSVRELHGLPFSGGSMNYFVKGAVLFLATIFDMGNDPRVVRTYETLCLLGEKREGRWFSGSCSGNILRAFIVHPLYRDSSLTRMYVKRLGQLQRPDGHWPPQIPFYQTVNALGHLDFLQSDDLLRRSFLALREKQNKDGTWGRTQREWNTFLIVHAMKRKHYLLSREEMKRSP
jgi:hypothetical protein